MSAEITYVQHIFTSIRIHRTSCTLEVQYTRHVMFVSQHLAGKSKENISIC